MQLNKQDFIKMYKEELELILLQNPIELELYSVIASLIRFQQNANKFSLRDFSGRKNSKEGLENRGLLGFPDFIVQERNTTQPSLYGAIEIKFIGKYEKIDRSQLVSHLIKYNKILYTDGLTWAFYEKNDYVNSLESDIKVSKQYREKKNVIKDKERLEELKSLIITIEKKIDLKKINSKWEIPIGEKKGSEIKWKDDNFEKLIKQISSIEW